MENYHRYHLIVRQETKKTNLKKYLLAQGFSSKLIQRIKNQGHFYLNGGEAMVISEIKSGDQLLVDLGTEEEKLIPENIPLQIIYEDEDLLVVNKEPFQVVHPTRRYLAGTLAHGAAYHFLQNNIQARVRLINRLDRNTSGIVLISKNTYAHQFIQSQLARQTVKKIYWALVEGHLLAPEGLIEAAIGRKCPISIVRSIMEEGQEALTQYKLLQEFPEMSLVELRPLTGRTHQLRVHLAHLGHPIIGDEMYNPTTNSLLPRQALHARQIEFIHPRTKNRLTITSELSRDIQSLML